MNATVVYQPYFRMNVILTQCLPCIVPVSALQMGLYADLAMTLVNLMVCTSCKNLIMLKVSWSAEFTQKRFGESVWDKNIS